MSELSESKKVLALQTSIQRFMKFSEFLQEEAVRLDVPVGYLLDSPERQKTVYKYLGIDLEKVEEEQSTIMENLFTKG